VPARTARVERVLPVVAISATVAIVGRIRILEKYISIFGTSSEFSE
jgi:hypothetical protein